MSEKKNGNESAKPYVSRNCNLKCYKCHFQGYCVIPRMLIKARRNYLKNSKAGNRILLNDKYALDALMNLNYNKKLRCLVSGLLRGKPPYRKQNNYRNKSK